MTTNAASPEQQTPGDDGTVGQTDQAGQTGQTGRTGRTDQTAPPADGIFSGPFLWVTIGALSLIFLGAFESLAVTTIMPVVSAELDGASLYALAFAGPLAVSVIGMVASGTWSDRSGPVAPLIASIVLFIIGLLLAGTATTMWMLVLGRLVQSLGSGAMTVALYVLVAKIYPPTLHTRIFAGFAAAWVVPSLVGPFVAGVVAQRISWHWVFLGVVGLVVIAAAMMLPAFRMLRAQAGDAPEPTGSRWDLVRLGWALLAAVAVLVINISNQFSGWTAWAVPVVGAVVAILALRPLVPRGTLTSRRGLPSVILLRGLASAAFFGAEVYLPYLMTREHGIDPEVAGLALTGGAVAWAGGSWLQGKMDTRLSNATAVQIGSSLLLVAVSLALVTALAGLSLAVLIGAWVISGAGMGLMYPRLSVMTLAYSDPGTEGFNSSAMSISDALGGALALAATGIMFTAVDRVAVSLPVGEVLQGGLAFAGCFAITVVAAIAAVVLARRVAVRPVRGAASVDTGSVAVAV